MDVLDLARLQFASTTLFHFIFVPLSIGLAAWTAICQTAYYRTKKEEWDISARFWGKLFLVSFALGVATGIVQEFQFGMNWSEYSRYVGDIFGAPLAMEALVAFFAESTFLGLWIFGRNRLSPRVHLATIWGVAIASMASAYFILAANAWMQHPVGYEFNQSTGRAEMTSIFEVLTNTTAMLAFPHTIFAAWATAGMVVIGVAAWHVRKQRNVEMMTKQLRIAAGITLVSIAATGLVGHFQGMDLTEKQPMKMAAAEALFETSAPAGMSLFATGSIEPNPERTNVDIQIPHVLSIMATGEWNGEVRGINDLNREYQERYGPGEYAPFVAITYWSWRAMIGVFTALLALCGWILFKTRRGRFELGPRMLKALPFLATLPFLGNFAGWIFTEMGRQPWIVQGLLKVEDAVSPATTVTDVAISLIGFTVLYSILGVIGYLLFVKIAKAGPEDIASRDDGGTPSPEASPSDIVLAY